LQIVGRDDVVEHPLDDPEVQETHLQFLPLICRYQYCEIAEFLVATTTQLWAQVRVPGRALSGVSECI
jgi:hypothetical protein